MTRIDRLRLRPLPARRAGRGRRAGFTLLELVVVAAVSSVLMLALLRWILTLNATSAAGLDDAGNTRSAAIAAQAFADDVTNASRCEASRPSPLAAIEPDSVSFFVTDPGSDTGVDLVTWSITAGDGSPDGLATLTRTSTPHSSDPAYADQPCAGYLASPADGTTTGTPTDTNSPTSTPTSDPSGTAASSSPAPSPTTSPTPTSSPTAADGTVRQVYATTMQPVRADAVRAGDPSAHAAFTALVGAQPITDPDQAWGDCTADPSGARCAATQLVTDWMLRADTATGTPTSRSDTYTFPDTRETLS